MDFYFGESFKFNYPSSRDKVDLSKPSSSYYYSLTLLTLRMSSAIFNLCHTVSPHRLSAFIILISLLSITLSAHRDCQLSSFLYHYSLLHWKPPQIVRYHQCHYSVSYYHPLYYYFVSQCQPTQMISYHHQCIITLSHTISQHILSDVIILVSLFFLTMLAYTDCQLSIFLYHYSLSQCHPT